MFNPTRLFTVAVASAVVGMLGVSNTAQAARTIRSLPHTENFDSTAYVNDILWVTAGGTHQHLATGGWRGGAARFTPPTTEGYTGVGAMYLGLSGPVPEQLNVRFLVYFGSTYQEYGPGNKLVIMNREGNRGRPMIITREWTDSRGTYDTFGACDGTVCRYYDGGGYPEGGDALRIGNSPLGREGEWISVELEANTTTGVTKLYIDTQDGTLSGLYIEQPMFDNGPGGTWSYIDIIGGYFVASLRQDPNNYFMLDELQIDSRRIGPPAGFVSATRPNTPTNVRAQ